MRFPIGLMAAALVAGLAPAASAATFTATIVGTVNLGTDLEGVFGQGSDLAGLPFLAVYTINDAAPGASVVHAPGSSSISGVGSVSSVLSINGSAPMAFGASAGTAEAFNLPDRYRLDTQSASTTGAGGPGTLFTISKTQDLWFGLGSLFSDFTDGDFRTPFVFTAGGFASNGVGFLEISELASGLGTPIVHGIAYAALDVSSFTLAALPSPPGPTGVPEPATWAMMILGFAGVGALLRARRGAPLAA
jgi:hypothetical protein